MITKLISKDLVSLEYRDLFRADLAKATVCRFLVAYVSQTGLNSLNRLALLNALHDTRSFGVGSLSCSCGYDPLVSLQSEPGPAFSARCKYFMDPKVMGSDEPGELSLFHSKLVYLFNEPELKSIVYIGSHNWTARALGPNGSRNVEASLRMEFDFLPEHLDGTGTSIASEVNRHLLDAWAAPLCYLATPAHEPIFEEWMQKACRNAPAAPVKEATIILAVCKSAPQPSDWLGLQNSGIYMQALDEEEGRRVWDTSGPILVLVWESRSALAASQQPIILQCKKTASNAGPNSGVAGNNQADSPMEGFKAIILDEAQLAALRQDPAVAAAPPRIWTGREVKVFDFEFPTTRTRSSIVDGTVTPLYQIYLQTEAVIYPADPNLPPRAQLAWERETFAVTESKEAARFEESPGYRVDPEAEQNMLRFMQEVLHVDPRNARVLPYSSLDAKVGKRISHHPLHDTYIDKDSRASRSEFYEKSAQGTLVPEIDDPPSRILEERQRPLREEPLPRVQRVFTMPIKQLFTIWKQTAASLHSQRSRDKP